MTYTKKGCITHDKLNSSCKYPYSESLPVIKLYDFEGVTWMFCSLISFYRERNIIITNQIRAVGCNLIGFLMRYYPSAPDLMLKRGKIRPQTMIIIYKADF